MAHLLRPLRAMSFRLALHLFCICLTLGGCAASEEDVQSDDELQTSRAEWKQRLTWQNGGPARGLDWKCVPEGMGSRLLCSAGGTADWTTASSITPAPTYALAGSTYTQVASDQASPRGRNYFSIASFSSQNKVVMFGGLRRRGVYENDTWTWNGTSWREESPAHRPPPRQGATLAEDPVTKHLVLFGGRDETTTLQDLWEWDGSDWTERTPSGPYPGSARTANLGLLVSSIASRGEILTMDPYTGVIWSYRGGAFVKHRDPSPIRANPAASAGTMAFDERRNTVLLFVPNGPVYEGKFDASGALAWTKLEVSGRSTPGTLGHSAYDRAAGNVVAFNGQLAWDLAFVAVPNRPPTLRLSQSTVQGFANEPLTLTAIVEDPDDTASALSVKVTNLPAGASFDAATRTFRWTPTPSQKGSHTVKFVATDGALKTAPVLAKIEVLWHDYAMLPTGSIDLLTGGTYGDSFTQWSDPDRRMLRGLFGLPAVYERKGRDGYFHREGFPWPYGEPIVACRFTGTNPGKVVATCIANNQGAQGPFGKWERAVAENGSFPNGRLTAVAGEGPAMIASGYEVYLSSTTRIRQTASVTSLLRPMPAR